MRPQSSVSYVGWLQSFFHTKHFGSVLALSVSLMLAACGGGGSTVTQNDLVDPGADGVVPTLTEVTIYNSGDISAYVAFGQSVTVKFEASESLQIPTVTIGGTAAEVTGNIRSWQASRAMTATDVDGDVGFSVSFTDISGEVGVPVTVTTDETVVTYCAEGCDTSDNEIVQTIIDFEDSSYYAVDVTAAGEVYSVNLSQVMTLTPATSYDVSFKAKGSVARDMIAGLGLNADPYSAATETVSLTTEWTTFTYAITTTTADGVDFGDANSRVLFDMGGAVGQVWIDDVSVK